MRTGIIITTNYDNLVERAFGDRPFDLVVHAIDQDKVLLLRHGEAEPVYVTPAKLDVDGSERPLVYKMRGTADERDPLPDQFLITEDDYVDFLTRMTRQKVLPAPVLKALMRSNVLFLGYGLGDWNVRVILNTVARQYNNDLRTKQGYKSWAIQYQVNAVEAANWQDRGVRLFVMGLDRFVDKPRRRRAWPGPEGGAMPNLSDLQLVTAATSPDASPYPGLTPSRPSSTATSSVARWSRASFSRTCSRPG